MGVSDRSDRSVPWLRDYYYSGTEASHRRCFLPSVNNDTTSAWYSVPLCSSKREACLQSQHITSRNKCDRRKHHNSQRSGGESSRRFGKMEEKGGMVEDAKDEAVEPVAESSVERSSEATPESAEDSSDEHSQREDAQTTPEAAEVLEEQEPPSVDDTEGSQTRSAEENQVVEDENDEGASLSGSPAETASSPCDAEPHDENAGATGGDTSIAISNDDDKKPSEDMVENNGDEGDSISSTDASGVADDAKRLDAEDGNQRSDDGTQNSQTQPNAPQSDDTSNSNTCVNDASEDTVGTSLERSEDGDVGDRAEAAPSASLDATDSNPVDVSKEGNDKAETNSSGMKESKSEESAPPNAASPSCTSDQKEHADISSDGGSPEICPCVYVTSNLIGMSLSGRSGSEQRRRRRRQNSGLSDEDYESSGHSKTSILGSKVDRASVESVLPSSFSPTRTPSRSPNRRRRRPGISPSHGTTSDRDIIDLETSGKDDPSGNVDNVGTKNKRGREVENGEVGQLSNSTPSTFLAKHHSNHFLCLNLTGSPADSVTSSSFNNQIINCPWTTFDLSIRESEPASSSGDDTNTVSSSADKRDRHRSPSTPSLAAMLDICYMIAAYQSLGSQNVACVYCDNGRTRTGVGIACYLKYEGRVRTSLDGFRLFCAKCNGSACEQGQCKDERDVASLIPPSLLQLFRNFDDLIDLQTWPNPQPLRLRAVIMQGVPVDDLPVVEIWSGAKGQIYNSHENDCREFQSELGLLGASAQWGCDNEEGFYLVDKDIQGEFTITCRFGGGYADDTHDPARILFRVTNHCAFFTWGPNELRRGKVDIMRRYADSFEDDFSLVLLFEPVGGLGLNMSGQTTAATKSYLPPIQGGIAAIDQGLRLITEYHSLQLKGVCEDDDDELTSSVARRITNNDDDSFRRVVANPQMVGVQNAIRAHKSRLAQNEKIRFDPMMPTSETSNAINTESTHNSANIVDQSNSSKLKTVDPRGATLSAIISRNKDERNEGKKDSGDPRAALLSAIKSNGSSSGKAPEVRNTATNTSPTQEDSVDPRAALLGAIKARKSAPTAENGDVDRRASMLSAIRTRQMPEDADEKSEKEEIEASPQPVDPRVAMLSAIKSRQKPADNESEDTQEREEAKPPAPPLDPRAAMLSAIKARQGPTDTEDDDEDIPRTEESKPSAPPLDPRAAMLSAIKARQTSTDIDNDDTPEKKEAKPEAGPPLDPLAAMLSAIKARQKSTEGTPEEKRMEPEAALSLDPRAAMLSAIKARQKPADDTDDAEESENKVSKPEAVPSSLDPRAAMLSAIKSRQESTEDNAEDTPGEKRMEPEAAPPLDPRAAMLPAIKAQQDPTEIISEDTPEEKKMEPEAVPSLDPRAAMLSAITARQKPADSMDATDDAPRRDASKLDPPPLDPRAAMLSAIKSKKKPAEDSSSNKPKEDAASSPIATSALNSNDRLLTAMKARGTDDKSSQLLNLLDGIAFGCDDTMEPESNSCTSVDAGGRFHPSTADYAPCSQPFTPSPGDVLKSFGSHPSPPKETDEILREEASGFRMSSELYHRPHLPLHPSLESNELRPMQQFLAQFESREDIASCIELLDKMPRSGIQIEDLMHLLAQSRRWSKDELNRIQQTMAARQGAIADASLSREGAAANAAAALAGQFQIATDSSAPGGSSGPSKGALAAADAVSQRLENNASVSQIAKDINKADDGDDGGDDGIPKLKDDPLYSKYFRMLKVGLPIGAVKNALQRDGQDPSIMDLDQNRPIQIQLDERNKYREFDMSDWM